jgi:hypothetical protein
VVSVEQWAEVRRMRFVEGGSLADTRLPCAGRSRMRRALVTRLPSAESGRLVETAPTATKQH